MASNGEDCFLVSLSLHPLSKLSLSLWWAPASVCKAGDPDSIPGLGRSPGEGNGNPLQYSCMKNPMDRWPWQATVHWVAKSQTRFIDWTTFLPFNLHDTFSLISWGKYRSLWKSGVWITQVVTWYFIGKWAEHACWWYYSLLIGQSREIAFSFTFHKTTFFDTLSCTPDIHA